MKPFALGSCHPQVSEMRDAAASAPAGSTTASEPAASLEPNVAALLEGMARGRASSAARNKRRLELEARRLLLACAAVTLAELQ